MRLWAIISSMENKETDKTEKSENQNTSENWKEKLGEIVTVCQDEIKRTTEIGKRMLSASKTNSDLHESYEELGKYICDQVRKKKLALEDDEVTRLIQKITDCEETLQGLEKEVSKIKEQDPS